MNAGDVRLYTVKPRRLQVRKPEERFVRIADVPFRSTGSITGLSDVGIRNTDVSSESVEGNFESEDDIPKEIYDALNSSFPFECMQALYSIED